MLLNVWRKLAGKSQSMQRGRGIQKRSPNPSEMAKKGQVPQQAVMLARRGEYERGLGDEMGTKSMGSTDVKDSCDSYLCAKDRIHCESFLPRTDTGSFARSDRTSTRVKILGQRGFESGNQLDEG